MLSHALGVAPARTARDHQNRTTENTPNDRPEHERVTFIEEHHESYRCQNEAKDDNDGPSEHTLQ